MPDNIHDLILAYLRKVQSANKEATKKETFKDLLNRLYSGEKEIEKIIDKISGGAEASILNIPREDKLHRGSADTLYNRIIIEFERDLKQSLNHAKEQLAGYLLGQFNSGEGYNFTLIATDCIVWKVFAPDISQLDRLETITEGELVLNEVESASIVLTEKNTEEFFYWIDRFLFREEKQRASLKRIEESFGYHSNVFIESIRELTNHYRDAKKFGEVQVSLEQWKRFLSIAYGSFEANEETFMVHTYLSVFSKMLAYAVVSNDDYIDDDEMKGILTGDIFYRYNLQNFIENDFFHWVVADRNFNRLKKVFRLIAQEISAYDFNNVDEDVLKGVYQELIDLDTRHALGEYYTPDWLCERIVNEFHFEPNEKILDPACGSGSFLRAAVHRVKELNPEIDVEQLNSNIYGIDIHPLSVQIAKTTMLLALGKEIINAKKPIQLNVIMANTLLAPVGVTNLFGGEFSMMIDREKLWLNTKMFEDVALFDQSLDLCESLADQTAHRKKETLGDFSTALTRRYRRGGISEDIIDSFYQIYESLRDVKEKGRDSIWKFIIQNLYKPYFLSGMFDYVIGNPPWFTYSSIKNEEYQDQLNGLANHYDLKPDRVANFPHLEIAAIFLSHCSSYFLKEKGKIAFVLPRSFLSADHHDNTRRGKAKGFRLTGIWVLNKVIPLFRIPSCVLFALKTNKNKNYPLSGIRGLNVYGRLPAHNCNYQVARERLTEETVNWFYAQLGRSSAFSNKKSAVQNRENPYKKEFKQGATIVPRAFYFIELDMGFSGSWQDGFDWSDRLLNIRTSEAILADAKKPWNDLKFSGRMWSNFIFRTALSKSILPFALFRPDLVALPIMINEKKDGRKTIKLYSADELRSMGFPDAAHWFKKAENIWEIHRTEKNRNMLLQNYLNWQNKLTNQNLNADFLVLYNSSAKDANATVVDKEQLDLELIVDHKTYWFSTNSKDEAFYLTSIINSTVPNQLIKDFQSRGLFGARDVHKKILDVYFPQFDESNSYHQRLAFLGKQAHEKVQEYLITNPPADKISNNQLGRLRLEIKKHLDAEIKEIDEVVRRVIG